MQQLFRYVTQNQRSQPCCGAGGKGQRKDHHSQEGISSGDHECQNNMADQAQLVYFSQNLKSQRRCGARGKGQRKDHKSQEDPQRTMNVKISWQISCSWYISVQIKVDSPNDQQAHMTIPRGMSNTSLQPRMTQVMSLESFSH